MGSLCYSARSESFAKTNDDRTFRPSPACAWGGGCSDGFVNILQTVWLLSHATNGKLFVGAILVDDDCVGGLIGRPLCIVPPFGGFHRSHAYTWERSIDAGYAYAPPTCQQHDHSTPISCVSHNVCVQSSIVWMGDFFLVSSVNDRRRTIHGPWQWAGLNRLKSPLCRQDIS